MAAVMPGVGDTLAGYKVERLLGRGGMGAVYLATHQRMQRRAALKVMIPELAEDASYTERFVRESELAASLDHPNVVPIYHADEQDGVLFIAMKYVEGADLKQVLATEKRLSLERTIEIASQVASALDAAHAKELVHRDVKPANVLIEESSGKVYLTDFGVAKRADLTGMTSTGSFIGTAAYSSPEQITGRALDGRTDVYSLACVVFHCLAGAAPFAKDSEIAIAQAHLHEPAPALSTVRPDLPRDLDGVIVMGMAKYPETRFQSAGAFVMALRTASNATRGLAETTAAESPPKQPEVTFAEPRHDTRPSPTQEVPRRAGGRRRKTLIAALLVLAALAAAAVAAVVLMGSDDKKASPPPPPPPPPAPVTGKALAATIADRISTIAPAQRSVNRRLLDLGSSSNSLGPLQTAAQTLQRQVLLSQGFRERLVARGHLEEAELEAFDKALEEHSAYARAIAALPAGAADLKKADAEAVVEAGSRAEEAYTRLTGIAARIPLMPVTRRGALPLLAVVPHAAPKPTTTPVTQPEGQSGQQQQSTADVPLQTFSGSLFEIGYPATWYVDTAEEFKTTYYDTTIRDPADSSTTYLRVDYTPGVQVSVEAAAGEQRAHHAQLAGYTEISYYATTLGGYPAIRWEFIEPQDGTMVHKVDVFLITDDSYGFAVLTQAPTTTYSYWEPEFERMYDTFFLR